MQLDHETCYRALASRDSRFDGKFFVGVKTTGIYCRPVCKVRLPKQENVAFFKSAAAAEKAGFRPCLKCRPESAPGYSSNDSKSSLAIHARLLMDRELASATSVADIARRLGVTDRYLRQIFQDKFGVRPVEYLQSRRLLTAKQLLATSELTISDIAFTSGFSSVRRMNTCFRERYKLPPSAIRQWGKEDVNNAFSFDLGYRPPYASQHLLDFLRSRLLTGMETISCNHYRRTVSVYNSLSNSYEDGWLGIEFSKSRHSVHITMADNLLHCFHALQSCLIRSLDLASCPISIGEELGRSLPQSIPWTHGLRIPGCMDFFETGVRAILGQQVTLKTAISLTQKFLQNFGKKLRTPHDELNLRFPLPTDIANLSVDQIATIGIFRQRAKAIAAFAKYCSEHNDIDILSCQPAQTLKALCELPGIGKWTANYIAMRGLSWQSATLETDAVIKNALAKVSNRTLQPIEIIKLHQSWQPWSSYACLNLWHWADNQKKLSSIE